MGGVVGKDGFGGLEPECGDGASIIYHRNVPAMKIVDVKAVVIHSHRCLEEQEEISTLVGDGWMVVRIQTENDGCGDGVQHETVAYLVKLEADEGDDK